MKIGVVSRKQEIIFSLCCLSYTVYFIYYLCVQSIWLLGMALISFFVLDSSLTYVHEFMHKVTAHKYGHKAEIIMGKERIKTKFNPKATGFCNFEEGDTFEYSSLIKIYMAPFKFFILSMVVLTVLFVFIPVILVRIVIVILIFVFTMKLCMCIGDVAAVIELKKNKGNLSSIYYSKGGFYMELKNNRSTSNKNQLSSK